MSAEIDPDRDREHAIADMEHKVSLRAADMAAQNAKAPRYFLSNPSGGGVYGGRVFLLSGVKKTEEGFSWFDPIDDAQITAAKKAIEACCMWRGADTAIECEDVSYRGYEFSVSDGSWELIQDLMRALLGDPGRCPPR